jgi:chemotaxis protein methyltransferase CheR
VNQIVATELNEMLITLKQVYGYDFTNYAESSIQRRTQHFMTAHKIKSLNALLNVLINDESKFEDFVQNISVTVTEMFRDPLFYKILRLDVVKRLSTYPFIKVWIAGCATGEEAYSIAILLKEEGLLGRSIIYATDINQSSLLQAKSGVFPLEYMRNYTINYQRAGGKQSFSEYYIADYNSAFFDLSLKKHIVFAPHNLAIDESFNEFNLILCRNVLIYFNQKLQNRAINLFYDSLCHFGFLGLGSKESIQFTDKKEYFDVIDKKEKIFMKKL